MSNKSVLLHKRLKQVVLLVLLAPAVSGAAPPEYQIKAAFLAKFTSFVEWPGEFQKGNGEQAFVIGIFGESPIEHYIEEMLAGRRIKNRKVKIRKITLPENISGCHMLFIPEIRGKTLFEILEATKGEPVLTVGDTRGFAEKGVMINFYIEEERVRFEINRAEVHDSGLSISYLLLKAARIVNPIGAER